MGLRKSPAAEQTELLKNAVTFEKSWHQLLVLEELSLGVDLPAVGQWHSYWTVSCEGDRPHGRKEPVFQLGSHAEC